MNDATKRVEETFTELINYLTNEGDLKGVQLLGDCLDALNKNKRQLLAKVTNIVEKTKQREMRSTPR